MIQNPFLPSPSRADAWAEGFTKGFTMISSPEPSENVSLDDIDAFNQGVATGSDSALNGISMGDPCIAALEESNDEVGLTWNGIETLHAGWEVVKFGKVAIGIASVVVVLLELAISLPVHVLPPEQVLPGLGQPVVDKLISYGLEASMELFLGAGLDASQANCEIRITPLFTSFDQARQAAIAMNRPIWIVVSWRTDQDNSFSIVDAN